MKKVLFGRQLEALKADFSNLEDGSYSGSIPTRIRVLELVSSSLTPQRIRKLNMELADLEDEISSKNHLPDFKRFKEELQELHRTWASLRSNPPKQQENKKKTSSLKSMLGSSTLM